MDFTLFKNKLIEKGLEKGLSDCEVYFSAGDVFKIKVFKGEISEYQDSNTNGVAFRGIYNGKVGYSYSEKVSDDVIDTLVENVILSAELVENNDKEIIYEGSKHYEKIDVWEKDSTSVEDRIKLALNLEKYAKSTSKYIDMVTITLGYGSSLTNITNSKGLDLSEDYSLCYAVVEIIIKKDDDTKFSHEIWAGKTFNDLKIEPFIDKCVNKTLDKIGATPVKSNKYNILLTNEIASDFLEIFSSIFSAEQVEKGFSILKGQMNKNIVSEKITIRDCGIVDGSLCNTSFDSEGVNTSNTYVIKNGKLSSFLYNLKMANKKNVLPTGNGYRSGFKGSITILPTNFFIEKGEVSFENMKKKMGNGLIIETLQGQHAGADAVSCQFSLQATGKLVENGEIVKSVENIVISGNFIDMLKNVIEVGSDFEFQLPSGSTCFGAPSLLIENISVAGE